MGFCPLKKVPPHIVIRPDVEVTLLYNAGLRAHHRAMQDVCAKRPDLTKYVDKIARITLPMEEGIEMGTALCESQETQEEVNDSFTRAILTVQAELRDTGKDLDENGDFVDLNVSTGGMGPTESSNTTKESK